MKHNWGPWYEHLNWWGEATGQAARRCADCQWQDREMIPTLCQFDALTRKERRARRRARVS